MVDRTMKMKYTHVGRTRWTRSLTTKGRDDEESNKAVHVSLKELHGARSDDVALWSVVEHLADVIGVEPCHDAEVSTCGIV